MNREALLRAASMIHQNGLGPGAELFSASRDEWDLRIALEQWQAENCYVMYGCEGPQPPHVRAALAFGNLRLMQCEFIGL